ncbi:hypothetical protein CYMTET_51779 [Cymbomonas tetramitiformis]|uniref:Uncharacterized protein n=1 Tax=Cymbomonas tetramitiformis TaxID=36881 RepID=A0AAE0ERG4_9CHLO|nr:hypothetical protein CYMTET_51779 [Cymbomonas tetramitiformis]
MTWGVWAASAYDLAVQRCERYAENDTESLSTDKGQYKTSAPKGAEQQRGGGAGASCTAEGAQSSSLRGGKAGAGLQLEGAEQQLEEEGKAGASCTAEGAEQQLEGGKAGAVAQPRRRAGSLREVGGRRESHSRGRRAAA